MNNSMHLIEFNIENYRSIKELTTLSMLSTPLHDKRAYFKSMVTDDSLLNTVSIYGANASGKSNVLRALFAYKKIVAGDFKPFETEPIEPFLLDNSSRTKDTTLEAVFEYKDKYFVYGFSLSSKTESITGEWLKVKFADTKRINLIYERRQNVITINKNMPVAEHGISRSYTKMTQDEELFINTTAKNSNWSLAHEVVEAWSNSSVINTEWHDPLPQMSKILYASEEDREITLALLQAADLHISDIKVTLDDSGNYEVSLKHEYATTNSIKSEWFSLDQESAGTQKFLTFTLPILYSLRSGSLMVLDEFDSMLHPDLLRYVVLLFNDSDTNVNHAQLIFTTHDTSLMDLFARDQIFFAQKRQDQSTDLFSLSEIKGVRKDLSNIDKKYLNGDFGAIPKIVRDGS